MMDQDENPLAEPPRAVTSLRLPTHEKRMEALAADQVAATIVAGLLAARPNHRSDTFLDESVGPLFQRVRAGLYGGWNACDPAQPEQVHTAFMRDAIVRFYTNPPAKVLQPWVALNDVHALVGMSPAEAEGATDALRRSRPWCITTTSADGPAVVVASPMVASVAIGGDSHLQEWFWHELEIAARAAEARQW